MRPMTQRLIRVYKNFDIYQIKSHLIIWGDVSASCAHCNSLGLKFETTQCPDCRADFKYATFRNIKDHFPKITKLIHERPDLILVDYEDFKRLSGALKAEEFLK